MQVRPIISMSGEHHFNEVFLTDVLVPDSQVFGTIGQGWEQVTSELSFERSGPRTRAVDLPAVGGGADRNGQRP